jgi:hypothetical protein
MSKQARRTRRMQKRTRKRQSLRYQVGGSSGKSSASGKSPEVLALERKLAGVEQLLEKQVNAPNPNKGAINGIKKQIGKLQGDLMEAVGRQQADADAAAAAKKKAELYLAVLCATEDSMAHKNWTNYIIPRLELEGSLFDGVFYIGAELNKSNQNVEDADLLQQGLAGGQQFDVVLEESCPIAEAAAGGNVGIAKFCEKRLKNGGHLILNSERKYDEFEPEFKAKLTLIEQFPGVWRAAPGLLTYEYKNE